MGGSSRSSIQKYNPFEIVVNTNIAGDSGVGNFQLKVSPTESYRYYVDWGDGSISASTTTTSLTHSYSVPGIYNVKVYGRFDSIYNNSSNEADKITDVVSWGNVKWRKFLNSFIGCANLTGMTSDPPVLELMGSLSDFNQSFTFTNFDQDLGSWDVSKVVNMRWVFNNATNFNNGGSPSISGWTTSNVTTMEGMFTSTPFNQDIGSWDVSNVINMGEMFNQASSFNNGGSPSISGWTTSACTDMRNMFAGNTSVFNQPIGSWDVSNVNNMLQMFYLNPTFNQPIGSWDVSNVNNMFEMFYLATNFDQNIGSWDVSNVSNMYRIFRSAINFNNGGSPSISGWTINSGFTNMTEMFRLALNFNQPIGSWDVSNVINMSSMFNTAQSFNQDIGSWDVSKIQSMNTMFNNATNFNNGGSPSISGWTTSACTNMSSMFNTSTLFNQPIGSWDVSNVISINQMFNNATNFNNGGSPSISGWTFNTGLTSMSTMFANAFNFNQPIGSWDVSNVNDMSIMFNEAQNFNQDIGSWDVSNVTNMRQMFRGADNFNQDLGSWDVSNVQIMSDAFFGIFSQTTNFNNGGSPSISGWTFNTGLTSMYRMFYDSFNFNQPVGSWDVSNVTNMSGMFDGASSFNQDISSWNVSGVTDMSNMLDGTAMSVANYNSILTGWTGWDGTGATKTLQTNVTFGASGLNYSSGTTAEAAKNYLVTGLTWTITDAGGI